jgi:hypothetical protein
MFAWRSAAGPPHCPFCLPAGPDAIVEVIPKNARHGRAYSASFGMQHTDDAAHRTRHVTSQFLH